MISYPQKVKNFIKLFNSMEGFTMKACDKQKPGLLWLNAKKIKTINCVVKCIVQEKSQMKTLYSCKEKQHQNHNITYEKFEIDLKM